MSNNNLARRTSVQLYFDNVDITNDINKSFKSLKYTDCETGETDDLQIELDDRDHKWVGEWLNTEIERRGTGNTASKKAELHAVICRQNWNGDGKDDVLDCGVFELDTVTLAGPPNTLNLQGTSISYESGIRQTKKSRAWENMNLSAIASKIASEGGYGISYISGFNPFYGRREQVDQPDISFLHELCRTAGISLKSTSKTLVLFDAAEFERADPVRTIKYGDKSYISYDFTTTLANTAYSACTVSYTPPGDEDSIDVTFNNPNMAYDENNVLKVSDEAVTSESEAYDLAWRRLRQANKGETTAQFTLPGDTSLVAGLTVQVSGFGAFDNKYIIETAEHSVKENYQLSLDLRQVLTGY